MAAIAKTQAQVVSSWETGTLIAIELAAKTPGVDGWTLLVKSRRTGAPNTIDQEVWTVT